MEPSRPTLRPEGQKPAPHESAALSQQEQLAKAQDEIQRFDTTVQNSQYTNKGSLIDKLA